jgi:hypothetical protein
MADVSGKFFSAKKVRTGVSPSSPGVEQGETLPPVNPPGSDLNSVGLSMPSAFEVANSPLTSNGTIAVTGAGTTDQYVRGDGSLQNFPSLTGYVPYTGATADVDLGTHDLTAERGTFANNGSSDTLTVNHTSGSGIGVKVTKGGNNEALLVTKTSGSGNAMAVVGGRTALVDLSLSSVSNATGNFLTISGGVVHQRTPSETRSDVGAQAQLNGTGFVKASGTTITYDNSTYQVTSEKGQPNGYASLDSNGKVPLTQINDALIGNVNYQGLWNASTNNPTLANPPSSGTKGYYYIVSTAGTFAGISFEVGDWIISNGSAWQKVDNTDAVSSVFGRTGNVIAANGDYNTSQVTENTNLYYTEARVSANTDVAANTAARHNAVTLGTANGLSLSTQQLSLQLASGSQNGALSSTDWTTFNSKQQALNGTGFVKISGTTISYDNSTYLTTAAAASTYLALAGGTMTGQIVLTTGTGGGIRFPNDPFGGGSDTAGMRLISRGGEAMSLEIYTTNDADDWVNISVPSNDSAKVNGNTIWNAGNITPVPTSRTITINGTTQDLSDNRTYNVGTVTSVTASSPLFSSGGATPNITIQQASGSQNGFLSSTDWTTFNNKQAALNGTGFVKISGTTISYDNSTYLTTAAAASTYVPYTGATSGVDIGTYTLSASNLIANGGFNAGALLLKQSSNAQTIFLGYTAITPVGNNTLNFGFSTGSGVWKNFTLSSFLLTDNINRTYTLPDASGTIALVGGSGVGTVTSVAALTLGTSGTDLSSTVANGTTTPVITLNVPTASATNRGALSAADWTTFNNKQNALTNPVTGTGTTNYLPKFTGTSTIGNSIVFDNGSSVGINTTSAGVNFSEQLQVSKSDIARIVVNRTNTTGNRQTDILFSNDATTLALIGTIIGNGTFDDQFWIRGAANIPMTFYTNSVERMRLDSSGNLGLGVTPSAGMTVIRSMQLGYSGIIAGQQGTAEVLYMGSNWLFDGAFRYQNNGFATRFLTSGGAYEWGIAPSGTAGNAISFTQAMTLGSNSGLSIGTPSAAPAQGLLVQGAANFSDILTANNGVRSNSLNGFVLRNNANTENLGGLTRRSFWAGGGGLDTQIFAETGYSIFLNPGGSASIGLTLASTGAATFSSSVTAGGNILGASIIMTPVTANPSSTAPALYQPATGELGINVNGGERMRIFSDGNVFIGSSPSNSGARLQVNGGDLRVQGNTNLGNSLGSTLSSTFTTRLSGFALRQDVSNRYGNYGVLILNSDSGWTSSARRFMITNGIGANKFGIIRSVDANTDPALGDAGSIASGTVDFEINNTGAATFSSSVTASGGASGVGFIMTNTTNSRQVTIGYTSGAAYNYIQAYDGTNFQPLMVNGNLWVAGNANIGIGTTAPTRLLEVSAVNPQMTLKSTTTTGFSELYFGDTGADNGYLSYAHNGDYLAFGVNNSERMRITSGGNVGIGIPTPANKLDVVGDGIRTSADQSTSAFLVLAGSSSEGRITVSSYGGFQPMTFYTGGSERMRITSGGNVLIGTTSDNGARLQVSGNGHFSQADANVYIQSTSGSGKNWQLQSFSDGNLYINVSGVFSALSLNGSTGAATFSSSVTAASFIPSGSTIPTNGMYLPSANTIAFSTNTTQRISVSSAGEVQLKQSSNSAQNSVIFNTTIQNAMTLNSSGFLILNGTTGSSRITCYGDGYFSGGIQTGNPYGSTSANWLLGRFLTETTSANGSIRVQIGSKYYNIAAEDLGTVPT